MPESLRLPRLDTLPPATKARVGLEYHVAGNPFVCVNNGDDTYSWQPLVGVSSSIQAALDTRLPTAGAPELIRDTMGVALVAGTNVTITPNDVADTITIAASAGTPAAHTHDAGDIASGTFGIARGGTGRSAHSSFRRLVVSGVDATGIFLNMDAGVPGQLLRSNGDGAFPTWVSAPTPNLTTTASFDMGALAAGATFSTIITLTGAAVNDAVVFGLFATFPSECTATAFITGADFIRFRVINHGATALTAGAQTYRFTIIKP